MSKLPYWTCPDCGSNLDHGERCNCKKDILANNDKIVILASGRAVEFKKENDHVKNFRVTN